MSQEEAQMLHLSPEDILIALLSSENHVKWSNYECSEFYDFALSSTAAIYRAMTIHDLNIVINVL